MENFAQEVADHGRFPKKGESITRMFISESLILKRFEGIAKNKVYQEYCHTPTPSDDAERKRIASKKHHVERAYFFKYSLRGFVEMEKKMKEESDMRVLLKTDMMKMKETLSKSNPACAEELQEKLTEWCERLSAPEEACAELKSVKTKNEESVRTIEAMEVESERITEEETFHHSPFSTSEVHSFESPCGITQDGVTQEMNSSLSYEDRGANFLETPQATNMGVCDQFNGYINSFSDPQAQVSNVGDGEMMDGKWIDDMFK